MVEVYQMELDQPCIDPEMKLGFIGLLSSVLKYNQDHTQLSTYKRCAQEAQ